MGGFAAEMAAYFDYPSKNFEHRVVPDDVFEY